MMLRLGGSPEQSIFPIKGRLKGLLILLVVACIAAGCVSKERFRASNQVQGKFLVHVVSNPPETLKRIAEWYTGSDAKAAELLPSSPEVDLKNLKPGDQVLIPFSVLKNIEPLSPLSRLESPTPTPKPSVDSTIEEDDDFVEIPQEPSAVSSPSGQQLDPLEELVNKQGSVAVSTPPGVEDGKGNASERGQEQVETFDARDEEDLGATPLPTLTPLPTNTAIPKSVKQKRKKSPDPTLDGLRRDLGLAP